MPALKRSSTATAARSIVDELRELLEKYRFELPNSDLPTVEDEDLREISEVEVDGFTYVLCRLPTQKRKLLSERQRQITLLVAQGFPNKTIAVRLGISAATVAVHLQRIFRKLNIDSRVQLARHSVLLG